MKFLWRFSIRRFSTLPGANANIPIEKYRNFGILAHIDAGKTTTTERMLLYSGVVRRLGEVDRGDTVMDYMVQERERGITIQSAAITFNWMDHKINLIDTPGHVDFTFEVERSLRVLDGAILVLDATPGVQPQTETVWRQAVRHGVSRIVYANKMDRDGANYERCIESIEKKFGANPIAIQIPIGMGHRFEGVVDLLSMDALLWSEDTKSDKGVSFLRVPLSELTRDDVKKQAAEWRHQLLEKTSMLDDQLLDIYLSCDNPEDLRPTDIQAALRRIVVSGKAVPVLCGSSARNKGVQPLLDAAVYYLPSPLDRPPVKGERPLRGDQDSPATRIVTRGPGKGQDTCALVFKVMYDRQKGQLTFFRVYSGTVRADMRLLNVTRAATEKPQRLYRVMANELVEVDEIGEGDIGCIGGFKLARSGDTLLEARKVVNPARDAFVIEGMKVPPPVFYAGIEAASKTDNDRLDDALKILQVEDPSVRVLEDEETAQTLVAGMGELHLEIVADRLKREFGVGAELGRMRIAYREEARATAKCMYEFVAPTKADAPANAEKKISLHVTVRPTDVDLDDDPVDFVGKYWRSFSPEMHAAVRTGVRRALNRGVVGGYGVYRVAVVVGALEVSGASQGDGPGIAPLTVCAEQAVRSALSDAECVLVQPIMLVEIVTPQDKMGDILSDLTNKRKGVVQKLEEANDRQVITAEVPLSSLVGYASALRSLSKGSAEFVMTFKEYREMGPDDQAKVLQGLM